MSLGWVKAAGVAGVGGVRAGSLGPDRLPDMRRPPLGLPSRGEGLTKEEESQDFPMAVEKPIAGLRPPSGVRRTATHSGVTHIREYQRDRYTIIGNHLAQHRELSALAIGLATYILSLPDGTPVDIRTLADRFPESRDRIAFALRELEAHGYLRRVRERTPGGRVITRTYAFNAPAATRAREKERQDVSLPPPVPPPVPSPAEPVARGSEDTPAAPEAATAAESPAESPTEPPRRSERHGEAVALLARLRRIDDRLVLSLRDVDRLANAAVPWLDCGLSTTAVLRTLTANLPTDIRNPAALIAHRLHELLPPALPPRAPVPREEPPPRPHPFQDCPGCDRVFRSPQPGRCGDCRFDEARTDDAIRAA